MSEPKADPKAYEILATLVDERLIARIERRFSRPLTRKPTLQIERREPELHVDPDKWRTGFLAVHERERPPQLVSDLNEVTPQASLRDLFRPVMDVHWQVFIPLEHNVDRGAHQAYTDARAAQKRDPLPTIEPASGQLALDQARRRAFLAEPWQPLLSDDQPRASVEVYRDPSLTA